MINRDELLTRIDALDDKLSGVDLNAPELRAVRDYLREADAVLYEARNRVYDDGVKQSPPDAGTTAQPFPFKDGEHSDTPRPVDDGPFLLLMLDENVSGGVWMRRYATKSDAVTVSVNYISPRQEWLFEIKNEFDMEAECEAAFTGSGF